MRNGLFNQSGGIIFATFRYQLGVSNFTLGEIEKFLYLLLQLINVVIVIVGKHFAAYALKIYIIAERTRNL